MGVLVTLGHFIRLIYYVIFSYWSLVIVQGSTAFCAHDLTSRWLTRSSTSVTLMNWILTVAVFPKTIKPYLILLVPYSVKTSAIVSFVNWNVSSPYDEPAVISIQGRFLASEAFLLNDRKVLVS